MNAGFKRVAKMIAAHHARTDWGAIVDLDTKDLESIYYLILPNFADKSSRW